MKILFGRWRTFVRVLLLLKPHFDGFCFTWKGGSTGDLRIVFSAYFQTVKRWKIIILWDFNFEISVNSEERKLIQKTHEFLKTIDKIYCKMMVLTVTGMAFGAIYNNIFGNERDFFIKSSWVIQSCFRSHPQNIIYFQIHIWPNSDSILWVRYFSSVLLRALNYSLADGFKSPFCVIWISY